MAFAIRGLIYIQIVLLNDLLTSTNAQMLQMCTA